MDDWSDSDIADISEAIIPESAALGVSQDLFSLDESDFSNAGTESRTASVNDDVESELDNDGFLVSGANTDWLSIPDIANNKSQKSSGRNTKRTSAPENGSRGRSGSLNGVGRRAKNQKESQPWSEGFPDDFDPDHDSLATLSPDKTQQPTRLPNFSFLKNSSVDSSFASPDTCATSYKPAVRPLSTNKRLGSRFCYPKSKSAVSTTSSDSQLDVDLEVMRPPVKPVTKNQTKSRRSLSGRGSKVTASESESPMYEVKVDLLKADVGSCNDETIMTAASVSSVASDTTDFHLNRNSIHNLSNAAMNTDEPASVDTSIKDRSALHVNTDGVVSASYTYNSLELSPSFRALAEELDDPQARPSETQLLQIERELDQIPDDEAVPGMSGWSSMPDIPTQPGKTHQTLRSQSINNSGGKSSNPTDSAAGESADVVYATVEESQDLEFSQDMELPPSEPTPLLSRSGGRRKSQTGKDVKCFNKRSKGDTQSTEKIKYSIPELSDDENLSRNDSKITVPKNPLHPSAKGSLDESFSEDDVMPPVLQKRPANLKLFSPKNKIIDREVRSESSSDEDSDGDKITPQKEASCEKSFGNPPSEGSPTVDLSPVQFTLSKKPSHKKTPVNETNSKSATKRTSHSNLASDQSPVQFTLSKKVPLKTSVTKTPLKELSLKKTPLKKSSVRRPTVEMTREKCATQKKTPSSATKKTKMNVSIDLTASDEDEAAGIVTRKNEDSDDGAGAEIDLTNSDEESQVQTRSICEDVPSGSEEFSSVPLNEPVPSISHKKRIIESDSDSDSSINSRIEVGNASVEGVASLESDSDSDSSINSRIEVGNASVEGVASLESDSDSDSSINSRIEVGNASVEGVASLESEADVPSLVQSNVQAKSKSRFVFKPVVNVKHKIDNVSDKLTAEQPVGKRTSSRTPHKSKVEASFQGDSRQISAQSTVNRTPKSPTPQTRMVVHEQCYSSTPVRRQLSRKSSAQSDLEPVDRVLTNRRSRIRTPIKPKKDVAAAIYSPGLEAPVTEASSSRKAGSRTLQMLDGDSESTSKNASMGSYEEGEDLPIKPKQTDQFQKNKLKQSFTSKCENSEKSLRTTTNTPIKPDSHLQRKNSKNHTNADHNVSQTTQQSKDFNNFSELYDANDDRHGEDDSSITTDNINTNKTSNVSYKSPRSSVKAVDTTSPADSPRRSRRITQIKRTQASSAGEDLSPQSTNQTLNHQDELAKLVKVVMSPLKDIPTNTSHLSTEAISAKKSKRKHNKFSHERLVIDDVVLPISQLDPAEQVRSLLDFLEDTASALEPTLKSSPARMTPSLNKNQGERGRRNKPKVAKLFDQLEDQPLSTSAAKKNDYNNERTSDAKTFSSTVASLRKIQSTLTEESEPDVDLLHNAEDPSEELNDQETMLDRSSFMELMGKSPKSRRDSGSHISSERKSVEESARSDGAPNDTQRRNRQKLSRAAKSLNVKNAGTLSKPCSPDKAKLTGDLNANTTPSNIAKMKSAERKNIITPLLPSSSRKRKSAENERNTTPQSLLTSKKRKSAGSESHTTLLSPSSRKGKYAEIESNTTSQSPPSSREKSSVKNERSITRQSPLSSKKINTPLSPTSSTQGKYAVNECHTTSQSSPSSRENRRSTENERIPTSQSPLRSKKRKSARHKSSTTPLSPSSSIEGKNAENEYNTISQWSPSSREKRRSTENERSPTSQSSLRSKKGKSARHNSSTTSLTSSSSTKEKYAENECNTTSQLPPSNKKRKSAGSKSSTTSLSPSNTRKGKCAENESNITSQLPSSSTRRKSADCEGNDGSRPKNGSVEKPEEDKQGRRAANRKAKNLIKQQTEDNQEDNEIGADSTPLDDSFELPTRRILTKREPIWLARYTVSRDPKAKNELSPEVKGSSPNAPTQAEAVCNLFIRSYGRRSRENTSDATSIAENTGLSTSESDAVIESAPETRDTSVYDFIPSQPSPVKPKKRGVKTRKVTKPPEIKVKKQSETQVKKPSKPRKNTKAAVAHKKELIKQINHDWGIDESTHTEPNHTETPVTDNDPPMSQATSLRHHIDDIDNSVTLMIDSKPKKHCRFRSLSSETKLSDMRNVCLTEENETVVSLDEMSNKQPATSKKNENSVRDSMSRDKIKNSANEKRSAASGDGANKQDIRSSRAENQRQKSLEVRKRTESTVDLKSIKTSRNVDEDIGSRTKQDRTTDYKLGVSSDDNGRDIAPPMERSSKRSGKNAASSKDVLDLVGKIKTEIGPDEDCPSTIQVTCKSGGQFAVKVNSTVPSVVQSDIRSFVNRGKANSSAITTSPSPIVRFRRRGVKAVLDDTDTRTESSSFNTTATSDTANGTIQTTLSPIVQSKKPRTAKTEISSESEASVSYSTKQSSQAKSKQKSKKDGQVKTRKETENKANESDTASEGTKGPTIKEHGRPTRNTQIGTKLIFTHTSLNKEQKQAVENCARILDAEVVPNYTPQGAAFCLEQSEHIPEEIFEVSGSSVAPTSCASFKSREDKITGKPPLLSGCEFYLSGEFSAPSPPKEQLLQLIQAGGAKILTRLPREASTVPAYHAPLKSRLSNSGTVIISATDSNKAKLTDITYASPSWLLDCIVQYKLKDC